MRCVRRASVFLVFVALATFLPRLVRLDAGEADRRLSRRDEALIELGRRLFFDPLVSRSGRRACSSCHDPEHGFSDRGRVSDDDFGRTRRHSQTLLDGALNPSAHWDGEFESVEELVLARVGALQGRQGRFGHGAALLEKAGGDDGTSEGGEIDDGVGPGGGDGGGTSYGTGEAGKTAKEAKKRDGDAADAGEGEEGATPPPPESEGEQGDPGSGPRSFARGVPGEDEPPASPSEGKAASPAAGAKQAPKKKAPGKKQAPGKKKPAKKGQAKKKADPDTAKRLSPKERRARADALRRDLRKLPLAAQRIERGGLYGEGFAAAFGSGKVSTARIARAVAAYCRSIRSTTSPYDRYAAGDGAALSASAARGLALFRGRARCATCHVMRGERAPFTDYGFHNTGVTWHGLGRKARARLVELDADVFRRKRDALEMPSAVDAGRARVSTRHRDLRSFKTPTLRDVARRGPYMHDGRMATLTDVVAYYAKGASKDPAQDPRLRGFAATETEVADLVAFLKALSGEVRPGLPARPWRSRAEATRLRLVDTDGRALAGVRVRLTPVGDVAARDVVGLDTLAPRTTDAKGWIAFPRTHRTHVRVTLPGGMGLRDGALVPDTCRKARVRVPVRGKTSVVVRYPPGAQAPDVLVAVHQGTVVLPGHEAPRTRLERTHTLVSGDVRLVRYEGWLRTDVPADVWLRVPGAPHGVVKAILGGKEAVQIDVAALR